jgi:hypothetical protein
MPEIVDPTEGETAAKTPTLNWHATQVNRCADGKGGFRLQDTPCAPPAAAVAAASAPTEAEITDLAALPPRPRVNAVPAPAAASTGTDFLTRGLLNGAWKLALLVLVLYLAFRFVRTLSARRAFEREYAESQRSRFMHSGRSGSDATNRRPRAPTR